MRRLMRLQTAQPQQVHITEPQTRRSIATRLRWSYLLSSTLPLLIVGALLLRMNASAQQSSVYNDQKNMSSRTARSIGTYIGNMYRQLRDYGLLVRPSTSVNQQWVAAAQSLQTRNYPNLPEINVLDLTGQELVHIRNLQAASPAQLQSKAADAAVRRALGGQGSFSAMTINRDGKHAFTLTLPLPNDAGAIIGVLRAEVLAEPIIVELGAATGDSASYAYLIQLSDGGVLLNDRKPDFTPAPQLQQLLSEPADAAEYTGARNQQVVGALTPVALGPNELNTGWAVVVEQPAAIAFASVRRSVPLLALLIVVVGALALLWAFREARKLISQVRTLQAGARAVGEGHLDHRINLQSDDELGDLAHAFDQMADHLQRSLAQIEQQNDRLRHGLALARDIQVGLLPDRPPWGNDVIAVYARSIPAYEVGGDFYTYLALPHERAAIAIGDISGKGVGAALLMALTSSALESQARTIEHPAEVLNALNTLLAPRLKASHMNAALLFAVLDPNESILRVANAGMIAPVVITPEGPYFIDVGGLPVGAFAGARYQEQTVRITPGDALLLMSDGVVEAHNAQGELFGFERIEALLSAIDPLCDMRTLVETVLSAVRMFTGDAEQHDDITLVAVRPAIPSAPRVIATDEEQTSSYATV